MMNWNMTYNSAKDNLIIPEYGRHVQLLVEHARRIEDPILRQQVAERIIALMMQMVPQNKSIEGYEGKLWRHLYRIAQHDLDVKPPENIVMPEDLADGLKPDTLEYPDSQARFRHYGHNVQTMIKRALAMEEGPKKDGFISAIAAYMKLAYKTWNRDHYVSDDVIKADLVTLSDGQIRMPEDQSLENLVKNTQKRGRAAQNNRGGKRNYSKRNNNNRRGNRRNKR